MRSRTAHLLIVLLSCLPVLVRAESIDIGPKVGAHIPANFMVRDAAGASKQLADITGERGVVIAFVRSAAWCPFCQQQLKDLQGIAADLAKKGYKLTSISYDAPEVLAKFAAKNAITYMMLSDQGSAMIDAFDIRDPQYKEGSVAFGVPKPAIFIVDKTGVVRAKLAEDGYKVRPTLEAITAAVDGIPHAK